MSLDLGASFKITAGVVGQAAVDRLNTSVGGLNDQVGKLPGLAKAAGLALVGLGAGVSFGALADRFRGVVDSILAVKDASERTGSSIENIGKVFRVAALVGEDVGQIEAGIIKLNKALAGADDESKGAARALDFIGLSIKDLRGLDPSEAMLEVAKALAGVEDGAGKSAIAMDIFGKSGAQLLPFLADFAERGDEVSRVTADMAEKADQYDLATKRLKVAQDDLVMTLGVQVLPVINDVAQVLLDVASNTDTAKGSANGLASSTALRDWFRSAALGAATLVESLTAVLKAVRAIAGSFEVVWEDIKAAKAILNATPAEAWAAFTRDEGKLAEVLRNRRQLIEDTNKRYAELWNGDMTAISRGLQERFDAQDAEARAAAAQWGGEGRNRATTPPKRSAAGYTSRAPSVPTVRTSEADPFGNAMDSLGQEAAKLQEQVAGWTKYGEAIESTKAAQVRFQIEQGKFTGLSDKQKTLLLMQAEAVDQLAQRLKEAKVEAEVTKQTEAIDRNTQSLALNARGRELAAFAQELETKGIKAGTDAYERLMAARRAAMGRQDAANDNPMLGLTRGLNDVADKAKGTGQIIQDSIVTAFDRAGDGLAEFVTKGKLNFRQFAASVLADLAAMIARQAVFNAVKAGMQAFGFADGGAFGTGAKPFAHGGAFAGGVQAFARGGAFGGEVVASPTLFKFAAGGKVRDGLMGEAGPEAIMPLRRAAGGGLGVVAQTERGEVVLPLQRGRGGKLGVAANADQFAAGLLRTRREPLQAFARGGAFGREPLQAFAAGGVPSMTPDAVQPPRRVSPGDKQDGAARGGGGVTIGSIVVHNNGSTTEDASGRNAAALGRAISQAVQAEILKQQRPGGLLAAA